MTTGFAPNPMELTIGQSFSATAYPLPTDCPREGEHYLQACNGIVTALYTREELDTVGGVFSSPLKTIYLDAGRLHRREDEGPAVLYANGDVAYYWRGLKHRVRGPAFQSVNGDEFWYYENELHRDERDGVAWHKGQGEELELIYYKHGRLHCSFDYALRIGSKCREYFRWGMRWKPTRADLALGRRLVFGTT